METMRCGTLWMGDLESYMDETFLKQAFTLMGENLVHAKVIKNRYTGSFEAQHLGQIESLVCQDDRLPMGYGFLDFGDEQTAQRVLHRCNGKTIPNASPPKRFKLNHASYGKEHLQQKEYSLFVGDLTADVDDLALYTSFSSRYPSVKAAKVVLDQNGVSKGYGFVRFTSEVEYQAALVEMQNANVVGSRPIRVSVATPKSGMAVVDNDMWTKEQMLLLEQTRHAVYNPNSTSGQDYSAYYQYPAYDYQNYYAAWQGYQQQQQQQQQQHQQQQQQQAQQYYSYGYDQAAYAAYDAQYQQQIQQYYESMYEDANNIVEEHDTPIDIEQMNEEAVTRNQELYEALDASRWLPPEALDPPSIPVK